MTNLLNTLGFISWGLLEEGVGTEEVRYVIDIDVLTEIENPNFDIDFDSYSIEDIEIERNVDFVLELEDDL